MVKHTFKTITEQAKDIEENRLSPLTLLEEYFYNISKFIINTLESRYLTPESIIIIFSEPDSHTMKRVTQH